MRMYYIFNIKEDIVNLYKDSPSSLFKILNSIYYMHREDIEYGFNLFNQLTNKIRIVHLSNQIYVYLHKDLTYSKIDNEHIINDLYNDEVSVLKVKRSHLFLQSSKNYSSFFKILYSYNKNYFVCDFEGKDFFFLEEINSITMK